MKEEIKKPMIEIIILISLSIIILILSIPKASALTQSQIIGSYGDSININNNSYENTTLITDGINARSAFVNYGEGNVIFNIVTANGGTGVDQIQSIIIENDRDQFICNIGSMSTYTDSTTQRALYTVDCPVNFSNGYGFKRIRIKRSDVYGILVATYSPIATFVSKDSPNDYQALINALDNQTNIITSTNNTNTSAILSYIQNQTTEIVNAINSSKQQQEQINQNIEDIKDTDISEQDKEQPDQTDYNNYQQNEEQLFDIVEQADTNKINIGMDIPTTTWIWNTMTTLIQSHSLIFTMIISILSIGVIKLALGR